MIFTTDCPSCETSFPIDSAKVPDGGVYARCSECSHVFNVVTPAADESPPAATTYEPPSTPTQESAVGDTETEPAAAPTMVALEPEVASSDSAESTTAQRPAFQEEPAVADHAATVAAPSRPPTFGKRDPKERAARLARVLVSDMIAYHPDRHRRSLAEGTLPQEFDEEIQKSWNEYVDQVGKDLAETTPYFRDALNQVLAQGADVF